MSSTYGKECGDEIRNLHWAKIEEIGKYIMIHTLLFAIPIEIKDKVYQEISFNKKNSIRY